MTGRQVRPGAGRIPRFAPAAFDLMGGAMPAHDAVAAPTKRRRFQRRPDQVAAARRFVADALARGSEHGETARLLVSETVTSTLGQAASGLGAGTFQVAYAVADGQLRVEVSDDGGPARLRRRVHGAHGQAGRGLRLVQTLASRWGVREETDGRTIWFELDLRAAVQRRPRAQRPAPTRRPSRHSPRRPSG